LQLFSMHGPSIRCHAPHDCYVFNSWLRTSCGRNMPKWFDFQRTSGTPHVPSPRLGQQDFDFDSRWQHGCGTGPDPGGPFGDDQIDALKGSRLHRAP
jgi:hypothetical protein